MPQQIERYGMAWRDYDDLAIEFHAIRNGGTWTQNGITYGKGLSYHYEAVRKLLWPDLDDHRWHRLCRDNILSHKITVIIGPGSAGKTHEASWIYLVDYFVWPEET